jgi:D-glycero-D-manno-heptose 1,7-bisphosphate phosphatase
VRAGRARTRLSAVFLDRDGVINRKAPDGDYVTSWAGFEFLPRALDGLALLAATPAKIIIATNQRGIARGRMTEADLAEIHRRMLVAIDEAGGRIDGIYHCPHEEGCRCRKPETGMFEAAAQEFHLRLGETAVVGDSPSDMLAASRIGAKGVYVGSREAGGPPPETDYVAADLADAARWLRGVSS